MTMTTSKNEDHVARFDAFVSAHASAEPEWLTTRRRDAIAHLERLGIPDTRHEDWKWTSLEPLRRLGLTPGDAPVESKVSADMLTNLEFSGLDAARVVLVNGRFVEALSTVDEAHVDVGPLFAGATSIASVREAVGRIAPVDTRAFTALATAFMADGVAIRVEKEMRARRPIHVISLTTAGAFAHPRIVLVAERESHVTLIETHACLAPDASGYATTPVTEVRCGKGADVHHLRVQRHPDDAVHLGTLAVLQDEQSRFASTAIDLGGRLARNELHLRFDGESGYCDVGALYVGRGKQVIDNHTRLAHAMPHCESHQLFKGVLDGGSRGIFDGKIHVHEDAQKTDAKQTARNLLLSDDAISNNKPQLEIYADDVKCTHGATTGQIDDDQLFYLRARGLDTDTARSLLTYAFVKEVVDRIEIETVRASVDEEVLSRLPMGELVGDAL